MNTENLTTDELFKALPNFVNLNGELYHFNLVKGNKRILVSYQTDEGNKYLSATHRSGKTLKEALKNMLDWLIKFEYYDLKSDNILIDIIKDTENKSANNI